MRRCLVSLLLLLLPLTACSRAKRYPLSGQVLGVDPVKQEITVKHEDIVGFMPGMTMPFRVRDAAALAERKPGDLITATLVVEDSTGYLADVKKTGEAPIPVDAARPMNIIEPGAEVPDAALTDQDGRARKLSDWRGRTIAVTFTYTRCPLPDFCPLMDRHFKAVQDALQRDEGLKTRAHLVSVSFDPDYDTPTVLKAHATRIGADPALWTYLTGPREAIDGLASALGVAVMRGDKPMQEILHNLRTAVIGPDGRLVTVLSGNDWKPEQLLEALRVTDGRR